MAVVDVPSGTCAEKGSGLVCLQVIGQGEQVAAVARDPHIVFARPDGAGFEVETEVSFGRGAEKKGRCEECFEGEVERGVHGPFIC